ncbi:hypothetical protein UFOVP1095_23 [uncultured Caudovirales phage]|uniref:Uncharacterized protein n=1 Tax=uncultured Caudovirales phage TaxID=2100421 RepID=A0A6J5QSI5_9CAUD|nr:hypothetical protein UFOVP918_23 [uncultured Caudovirales phage]CAB4182474.1 hypothetical protein UFOVP1095_23 [uncultured Caudovirales phage]CAB4214062.1 hypothetical protein UFOVP1452_23 [uncultured Caudovirales phage]CAB5228440.1 hypothetical protein UFOVP1540_52 [uncultured Caudovirales phage]
MSADSKTQIVGTTGWAEQEREIERLNSLVSENAADSLKWRTLFQSERDNMNAAQEEINRLTHNQQMQDSITAQVMERAEKAEDELSQLKSYYAQNPLGGVARTFQVMAERIAAGENYEVVISDYGLLTESMMHNTITKLEAEAEVFRNLYINEQAECAALKVDAERYRYLQSQCGIVKPDAAVVFNIGFDWANVSDSDALDKATDAAIDAARKGKA